MEKCRPANVKELEVKAKRFIVSQWQGLSPVLSRKVAVCSTKACLIYHWRSVVYRIRLESSNKYKKQRQVLLSFDQQIVNQPHNTVFFTTIKGERWTHTTAHLIDFELKILSRIQKYCHVKVKQCSAHSDLQTLHGFWANNDHIDVFDSECISSQLILNRS